MSKLDFHEIVLRCILNILKVLAIFVIWSYPWLIFFVGFIIPLFAHVQQCEPTIVKVLPDSDGAIQSFNQLGAGQVQKLCWGGCRK